jgi:hypothetical protein
LAVPKRKPLGNFKFGIPATGGEYNHQKRCVTLREFTVLDACCLIEADTEKHDSFCRRGDGLVKAAQNKHKTTKRRAS